uniref:K-box domain-containing protein n=1 Tax=Kalanchoe fedtschenkoi TaxID=63787 RepID=A0A7N0UGH6_KALFE
MITLAKPASPQHFPFQSNSSPPCQVPLIFIKATIEEYNKLKGDQLHPANPSSEVKFWKNEVATLQQQLQSLQEDHRKVFTEELASLTIKELQHLENQLEMNLKCIRMKKDEIMMAKIDELRQKGSLIQQENLDLHNQAMCHIKNIQVHGS